MQLHLAKLVTPRSPHWPAVRKAFLKLHGVCAATGLETGLEVHHKKPFHLFPELELEPTNLITLTEHATFNAHLWIGHAGNWKWFNPHVVEDAAQMLKRIKERLAA
jgi:5-methylcytosine-specific restriction protein A